MVKSSLLLPDYPKVIARRNMVVILHEDGKEEIWGHEPNAIIAKRVAKEIEVGLKSIKFVTVEIMKKMNEISDNLIELGIPPEYTEDIIYEGFIKISKWFNQLELYKIDVEK